jgi:polar amino acid transport system substrate-binding protein
MTTLVAALAVVLSAAEAEPMRWGADAQGGAPYVFQDPMNPTQLVGFEVDLAALLAERQGRRPEAVSGPWANLLELLARGDFDVALNGIVVADDKRRVVALSRPYFASALVVTVRRDDTSAPRNRAQLQGRVIGTLPGSLAERIAHDAGAQVRTYDGGQNDLYDDLALGRLDGVLLDAPVARYYGDLDDSLQTVSADFGVVQYAVAVRLDDGARLEAVNAALTSLQDDGSLRRLYERWGLWSAENAALFHDATTTSAAPAPELERWREAVRRLPPLWERVRTRYPALLPLFLRGAGMTLGVSLGAMALAVLLGVTLALARRTRFAALRWAAVAYIEFFRGTPLLIQLTMVYFGLPELGIKLGPFTAGVVALGLNYAAAEAENYRAGLESVPAGQLEASAVLGLSPWQTLRFVVAPQALRVSIPPMTNDFIALLKDSSLISLVTLTELTKTYTSLASSTRDHLGLGVVVALWYLAVGLPFARLARRAETYFGRHLKQAVTS